MTYDVVCADVLEWAAGYDGEPFHAMLTDCPYEMNFMSKGWDDSGVSFDPETWRALAEHLLPGAFLFVFGGTINDDLISVALRRAGLRKHHKMFVHLNGQGFPKSTQIGKNGNHPEWAGHRYGGQCLKPSADGILVFQKPYEGKPVESIVETGAGSLWIDGGRIGGPDGQGGGARMSSSGHTVGKFGHYENDGFKPSGNGRWPANFALCHSPGCVRDGVRRVKALGAWTYGGSSKRTTHGWADGSLADLTPQEHPLADADGRETVANFQCVEGCPVKTLGEQSGESIGFKGFKPGAKRKASLGKGGYHDHFPDNLTTKGHNDKGTAARFFHNASWSYEVAERLAGSDAVRYCAKSSRRERDAGLDGERSNHPTVKPIALTQWLATLLLPPDAYAPRRILIPFGGVASEGIGAMLAGWEHITLVEMDSDYCDIARARLAWWAEQADGQMWPNVKQILKNAK